MLGVGEALSHANFRACLIDRYGAPPCRGPKAYAMAGVKPAEVEMLSLTNAFTITPILFIEDLGSVPRARGTFRSERRHRAGGKLPV